MANLKKELNIEKKSYNDYVEASTAVTDVKLLLDVDSRQDLEISRALGYNHTLSKMEKLRGEKISSDKSSEEYGGNVFTKKQIEKIAVKYDLVMLQSSDYKGNIPIEAIHEMKRFINKHDHFNKCSVENRSYILGPRKLFNIENIELESRRDPALFFKINDNAYKFIHQWGTDFTILNRVKALYWKNAHWNFWIKFIHIAILGFLIFSAFTFLSSIVSNTDKTRAKEFFTEASYLIPILFVILRTASRICVFSEIKKQTDKIWSVDSWESNESSRKAFIDKIFW